MIAYVVLAAIALAAVVVELFVPGKSVYQSGWYNVLLVAIVAVLLLRLRPLFHLVHSKRGRVGITLLVVGTALAVFAGVVNGLLAPEPRTIVGAPGSQVRIDELGGSLLFPLTANDATVSDTVRFSTPGSAGRSIGSSGIIGSFIARSVPRAVVYVSVTDVRGGHLTITQPTGEAFLSPVLLMQQTQNIHDLNLPYDGFSVPAMHRVVRAVLFSPEQLAEFRRLAPAPGSAVLFDVENENGSTVPGGLTLVHSGDSARAGGLVLHPSVITYPAIELIAIPSPLVCALAVLLVLVGVIFAAAGLTSAPRPV